MGVGLHNHQDLTSCTPVISKIGHHQGWIQTLLAFCFRRRRDTQRDLGFSGEVPDFEILPLASIFERNSTYGSLVSQKHVDPVLKQFFAIISSYIIFFFALHLSDLQDPQPESYIAMLQLGREVS